MNKSLPTPKHNLKENLNKLIDEANILQIDVIKKTKIPQATIHRLTHLEGTNPTLSILVALAKFFGVTIDELLGGLNDQSLHKRRC